MKNINQGFYLTELLIEDNQKSKIIETQELKEINDNFSLTSNSLTRNKNQKILEKTNHNVLDYLIREQSEFADLFKVENYFKNIMISKIEQFNNYNKLLKSKQKEIEQVEELINRELIENIDLEKEEMIEIYENEKDKLSKNIGLIEHDTEGYRHIYNKLYKTNVKKFSKIKIK
jgi:hypothetical protein